MTILNFFFHEIINQNVIPFFDNISSKNVDNLIVAPVRDLVEWSTS